MPDIDDTELANLRAKAEAADSSAAALEQTQQLLTAATETNLAATNDFLEQARAANPDIPADAIAGDTIAAIKASTTAARQIADAVKASSATTTPTPTPITSQAAAPPRTPAAVPEGTRGADRIRFALNNAKE